MTKKKKEKQEVPKYVDKTGWVEVDLDGSEWRIVYIFGGRVSRVRVGSLAERIIFRLKDDSENDNENKPKKEGE